MRVISRQPMLRTRSQRQSGRLQTPRARTPLACWNAMSIPSERHRRRPHRRSKAPREVTLVGKPSFCGNAAQAPARFGQELNSEIEAGSPIEFARRVAGPFLEPLDDVDRMDAGNTGQLVDGTLTVDPGRNFVLYSADPICACSAIVGGPPARRRVDGQTIRGVARIASRNVRTPRQCVGPARCDLRFDLPEVASTN